jgi:hypothetical protein
MADSEIALVAIVRKAAADDWRAAAHLLACRWPERWAQRARLDVNVDERQLIQIARDDGIPEGVMLDMYRQAVDDLAPRRRRLA